MKERLWSRGCVIPGLLVVLLLAAGGAWWLLRSRFAPAKPTDVSPVHVFLTSPVHGDEVNAGDQVPVRLQAIAPEAIESAELFVDGQSVGSTEDSPGDAWWSWEAWPPGVHTLMGRARTGDGESGDSQTVILNVLAGDGSLNIRAKEGQSLEEIGAHYGIGPDAMGGANPDLKPTGALQEGQPVSVPVPVPPEGADPPAGGGDAAPEFITINWDLKINEAVEESYCYYSDGGGAWSKIPKNPFAFFEGTEGIYTQLVPIAAQVVIQVECWGWQGGDLKFLGEGGTSFDISKPPPNVVIQADGFVFTGSPHVPITVVPFAAQENFPPPYGLREPANADDCKAHGFLPVLCDIFKDGPVESFRLLEWEWQQSLNCWATACPTPDGFRLYIIDQPTNQVFFAEQVYNGAQRATLVPLAWGGQCYGIRAYVNAPAYEETGMEVYCPGDPADASLTLEPTAWLTTAQESKSGCEWYGDLDYYTAANEGIGFGNNPGEIMVGALMVIDPFDCFKWGEHSGAVKFDMPALPQDAIILKATLGFNTVLTDYNVSGVATNYTLPSCVEQWNVATEDWTGHVNAIHFKGPNLLYYSISQEPGGTLSTWVTAFAVDVTAPVLDWIEHPSDNHGFIFHSVMPQKPAMDGGSTCYSRLDDYVLKIDYVAP